MGLGWILNRGGGYRTPDPTRTLRTRGVAVIGGSEPKTSELWSGLVEPVVDLFAASRWSLVYCGMGGGLSGRIATQAIRRGVSVKAILMRGQEPPDVPEYAKRVLVADYYARQKRLFQGTTATLVLPGGTGTIAELTTAAGLAAAGLIKKPVLLDPDGWFDELGAWYGKAVRAGAARHDLASSVHVVTTVAAAREIIQMEMVLKT